MRRVEITAAGLARPDLGQWAGLGQERLEADPAQPPTVPGIGVGVADPPRALGWARAVPAVAVSHGAALIRTPAPLEHRGFAGGQPLLDVGRGRGRELAAVDPAEQPGSVPVGGATRHRAAQHSGQPAPGTRPDAGTPPAWSRWWRATTPTSASGRPRRRCCSNVAWAASPGR